MKTTELRCAVIGVGYLGKFHAEKYTKLPNTKLVAVCDLNEKAGREVAEKLGTVYEKDYRQLFGKVDAVSIATTTTAHYQIAKECLREKIHVLLEKPITTTVKEAQELIALAEKNDLTFQIGHIERFNPVIRAIRQKVNKPIFIESIRRAPFQMRGSEVSVILDLMIHDIDLIQSFVKAKIAKIEAIGTKVLSKHIDLATARILFENGVVANVTANRIDRKKERKFRIFADGHYFSADLQDKTLEEVRMNVAENGERSLINENFSLENNDALFDEVKSFVDAVKNHKVPEVTGLDGLLALETAGLITAEIEKSTKN